MNEPKEWCDPRAWNITGEPCPPHVWDIIQANYIPELRRLLTVHGVALVPSGRSCYRSPAWERAKGRNGRSFHCFPVGSLGACDLVRAGGLPIDQAALHALRSWSAFSRICHYPNNGFVHVDYGGPGARKRPGRTLFTCKAPAASWVFVADMASIPRA